jgi:hypothetical protein
MKPNAAGRWWVTGALLTIWLVLPTLARDGQPGSAVGTAPAAETKPTDSAKTAAPETKTTETSQPNAPVSNGVAEVLKMLNAGVSKDVLKTFIETSPVAYNLSSADLIALKQRGVPDEITMALLKRGAETRAQAAQAANPAGVQAAPGAGNRNIPVVVHPGYLDPDGYDYFHYYYLHPRALADAQQRLGIYPGAYGYYPGLPGYYHVVPRPVF